MANICTFSMKVVGEKPNVESFVSALEQKGKFCMGRGGFINVKDDFDGGSILYGKVKHSRGDDKFGRKDPAKIEMVRKFAVAHGRAGKFFLLRMRISGKLERR